MAQLNSTIVDGKFTVHGDTVLIGQLHTGFIFQNGKKLNELFASLYGEQTFVSRITFADGITIGRNYPKIRIQDFIPGANNYGGVIEFGDMNDDHAYAYIGELDDDVLEYHAGSGHIFYGTIDVNDPIQFAGGAQSYINTFNISDLCIKRGHDTTIFSFGNQSGTTKCYYTFAPILDAHSDLGTSALNWKDLYLSNSVKFGTYLAITKDANNDYLNFKYGDGNIASFRQSIIYLNTPTEGTHFLPQVTNTYDLGNSSKSFKTAYVNTISGSNSTATDRKEVSVYDLLDALTIGDAL